MTEHSDTTTITLDVTLTHREDQQAEVPVTITVEYPNDHGLYAVQAIHQLNERSEGLIAGLAREGDKSILRRMDEEGLALAVDEEDE